MGLLERQAVLLGSQEVAPAIRLFRFAIPEMERFDFVPGQWVSLVGSIEGKKVTRAYSLASLPQRNEFEICLNRVEGGLFSPYLFSLEPGQSVTLRGPVGTFTYRDTKREVVMVATGTGVVPFRPMLRQAGLLESGLPTTLIFGARYPAGLLFAQEFAALASEFPNFRFWPTVTRPDESWRGAVGRVQGVLWERLDPKPDVDIYICGLKEMVDDVRDQLKLRGFDKKQIIYEKYD